jgi:hypothetical protein
LSGPEILEVITFLPQDSVRKTKSLQLLTDEPWDTMKAQILVLLSAALNPPVLDFENYELMFHIPRVLPKPGLSLASEAGYLIMNGRGCNMTAKDPTINIFVVEKLINGEKENDEEEVDQEKSKDKGKKVRVTYQLLHIMHSCFLSLERTLQHCQEM